MIRLIQLLIWGHIHNWKARSRTDLKVKNTGELWDRYILQCTKCGEIKKVDLV